MSANHTNENKEPVDESEIDWSGLGEACNKMYEVIHSLHLSEDVLNDDDALDAILREKGYLK